MRGRKKLSNQLSIFDRISAAKAPKEPEKGHQNREVKGQFRYAQDSKWYHRFHIETENEDIVGSVYISKSMSTIPDRIVLERIRK